MFQTFLLGHLFGLSENRLLRELKMPLGYRWFGKLSPDEAVSDQTTPNKLRNHRWTQSGIVVAFLCQVIDQCINQGGVKAPYLSVDGSQAETNASVSQFGPIEVEKTVDKLLARFELNEYTEAPKSPCIDQTNSERSSQEPESQPSTQGAQRQSKEKLDETTPGNGGQNFRAEKSVYSEVATDE